MKVYLVEKIEDDGSDNYGTSIVYVASSHENAIDYIKKQGGIEESDDVLYYPNRGDLWVPDNAVLLPRHWVTSTNGRLMSDAWPLYHIFEYTLDQE